MACYVQPGAVPSRHPLFVSIPREHPPVSTDPTISVVIPTYNRSERLLTEAIDSVLEQDPGPDEVIVVDDGSDPPSSWVADRFGDGVDYLHRPNGGIGAARNTGVARASGELLAFLDSDDVWEAHKLRLQLDVLAADPEVDAVFGRVEQFYDAEVDAAFRQRHPIKTEVIDAWLSSAMLIRRTAFDRVGPFTETLPTGVDMDWFLRARDLGLRMEMLADVVYRRRFHETNISITQPSGGNRGRLLALKQSLDRRRAAEAAQAADEGEGRTPPT